MTIGMVVVARLAASSLSSLRHDDIHVESHKLRSQVRQPLEFAPAKRASCDDVLPLDVTKFPQRFTEAAARVGSSTARRG